MSVALVTPPDSSDAPPRRKRFTRAEVEQMCDAGLFAGQRLELIDGDLIDKMGKHPPHAYAIGLLNDLLAALFGTRRVRVQLPIEAAEGERESSLPEPDLSVLREAKLEYQSRFPNGPEMLLAVEVADTTAHNDLTKKRDLYCRAEVKEYWVLDLNRRCLVVHSNIDAGRYLDIKIVEEHESVRLDGADSTLAAASMLPQLPPE